MAPVGYDKIKLGTTVDLNDKEVYLVQVPRTFDVKKAEFKSNTEVVCQGNSYFVSTGSALADCSILNVDKDGKLTPSKVRLDGLLSFTKKVSLPKVDYEKVTEPKPTIPQRENLRMRHFPTGYGPGVYGVKPLNEPVSSISEEKRQEKSKEPRSKNKHKLDESIEGEKPAKKQKKHSDEKKSSKKHKSKE